MPSLMSRLPSVLAHYTYTLVHYTDTTVAKVLPGLILDAFFLFKNSSPESFEKLAEWGKTNGNQELKHFQNLQYKKWYFYPLEYVKTTWITTARKAYYYAASQNAKPKAVTDLVKDVKVLAIKHLKVSEEDDGLALDTFEDSITKIVNNNKKGTSWEAICNPYSKYPNTRIGHYTAWAIRLGIFYYFSPINSRLMSTALTATGIYFWTILLTPGARKDLANIKAPEEAENELPEEVQNAIIESASNTFQKNQNDDFENDVRNLKVQIPIEDPFKKNEDYYKKEYYRAKSRRDKETRETLTWYPLDWAMRTHLIGYYNCLSKEIAAQEQEDSRKEYWLKWHKINSQKALDFINEQTNVPKGTWSEWIPKKKIQFKPLNVN